MNIGQNNKDDEGESLEEIISGIVPPELNLEGRIDFPLTPKTSVGALSDICTTTFKTSVFCESQESPLCVICRNPKYGRLGSYCSTCESIWDGKLAVKRFRVLMRDRSLSTAFSKELLLFSKLSHPNVLPFVGYLSCNGFPAIVTPWVEEGELYSQIRGGKLSDSYETILFISRGIADGLAYLHSRQVLHCKLKPMDCTKRNVYLSSTGVPLLSDFGLLDFFDHGTSAIFNDASGLGNLRWTAPELFRVETCSEASDIWAFGMVLYELLTHELPYHETRLEIEVMRKIISGVYPTWPLEQKRPEFSSSVEQSLRNVCEECWSASPVDRPNMRNISDKLYSIVDEVRFKSD
ncbi:kinase-like protein [Schizopora paradoxa]|uniref:Kinase-like protein n=1 Tax=Schizopora paradoxa TaxID=27342 RepID=A0A0H2R388_9AGAM|nr:kinase-like protein [Schizopora paradoxa]